MKRNVDIIALIILIVSAANCGLIGIFQQDLITWLFGGPDIVISRIIYLVVAAAGMWSINLLLLQRKNIPEIRVKKRRGLSPAQEEES